MAEEKWKSLGPVGYLGSRRDAQFAEWDEEYGKGNWKLGWRVGDLFVSFAEACILYEDAYFRYFEKNPAVFHELISTASNVYDDAPSNVLSGFDYTVQETGRTHVQDIAIRRCVYRLGEWFFGTELIQIRDSLGTHPLSMTLSPGQVPFHLTHLLEARLNTPAGKQWWKDGSVEDFYQRNRRLFVKETV